MFWNRAQDMENVIYIPKPNEPNEPKEIDDSLVCWCAHYMLSKADIDSKNVSVHSQTMIKNLKALFSGDLHSLSAFHLTSTNDTM